jgi:hypothetical protein
MPNSGHYAATSPPLAAHCQLNPLNASYQRRSRFVLNGTDNERRTITATRNVVLTFW